MQRQYQKGFTLVEMIIVLAIIGIVTTAIAVNIGATNAIRVEGVVSQLRASIANVRRESLKDGNNPNSTTFTLASVYGANPPFGIRISPTSSNTSINSCQCAGNLKALCLADQTFCYDTGDSGDGKNITFTFEAGSGRLSNNHAIFISSETRSLALLINHEGNVEIAEFIGGRWHTKTSLQQPQAAEK